MARKRILRSWIDALKRMASSIRHHCRPRSFCGRLKYYLGGMYHRADRDHLFLLTGGIAFSVVFCIIPLVLVLFWVIGLFLEPTRVVEELRMWLERAIPYPQVAEYAEGIIGGRIDEFAEMRNPAGIIGAVSLVLMSTTLFSSIRTALNKVFRVKQTESILTAKLLDLAFILGIILYFLLATALLPGLDVTQSLAEKVDFLQPFQTGIFADTIWHMVSMGTLFLAFFLVYLLVPYERPPVNVVLMSSVWACLLWKVAVELFGFYFHNIPTVTRAFGAYATLIIIILWVYYSSLVLLMGAQIGQLWRERRMTVT